MEVKVKKVLVIDDRYFIKAAVEQYLSGVAEVDHMYCLPDDESCLAKYDALVVDGDGIGNDKFGHGLDFCKAYDKPEGQAVVYHSGLSPSDEDCKLLEKRGVAVVCKGGNPEKLSLAIRFPMEKK